jgi:hypothetical protein
MAQYSLKIFTYDPAIIDAFERLRKNRKQAAYTQEALKQFLSTGKGCQVLLLMEGKTSEPSSTTASLPSNSTCMATPAERVVANTPSAFTPQSNSSSVLDSILK